MGMLWSSAVFDFILVLFSVGFVLYHPSGSPLGEANGPWMIENEAGEANFARRAYSSPHRFVVWIPEGSSRRTKRVGKNVNEVVLLRATIVSLQNVSADTRIEREVRAQTSIR